MDTSTQAPAMTTGILTEIDLRTDVPRPRTYRRRATPAMPLASRRVEMTDSIECLLDFVGVTSSLVTALQAAGCTTVADACELTPERLLSQARIGKTRVTRLADVLTTCGFAHRLTDGETRKPEIALVSPSRPGEAPAIVVPVDCAETAQLEEMLVAIRVATGLDGRRFSKAVRLDPSAVSRLEAGERKLTARTAAAYMEVGGIPSWVRERLAAVASADVRDAETLGKLLGSEKLDGVRLPSGRHASSLLASWRTQRSEGTLSADVAAVLDREAPGWETPADRDAAWREVFDKFVADMQSRPKPLVFGRSDAWSNWVEAQRRAYAKGTLAAWRVDALSAVEGWSWVVRRRIAAGGAAELASTVAEHGWGSLEPNRREWVRRQQRRHSRTPLSEEAVAALEAIPGWRWDGMPS